jgi:nitroreductase
MQVSHAIKERRSVRAFLPDPVPAKVVTNILELTKWAPSWANAQDWNVYVVDGATLETLNAAYVQLAEEEAPRAMDLPAPAVEWPAYLAERMDVKRPSSEGTISAGAPSFSNLWGAPTLVLFAVDAELDPGYACFDAGLLVQTFCLAAEDRGFATCIMAMAVRYADILHELIPQAAGKRFVVGVALGLADHTAVINRGERKRVAVSEWATFVSDSAEQPEPPADEPDEPAK